jgi:precorrin-6A/cobalt-precorrin-6A reductase
MQASRELQSLRSSSPSPRLWLIAGTGEGPALAVALLRAGWRLRVSVVTAAAALAYPDDPALDLQVGSLGGPDGAGGTAAVAGVLAQAADQGDPFEVVIDASHPFAVRISASLARACAGRHQPLLRLQRPLQPPEGAELIEDLHQLGGHVVPGDRLLLAIGARRLSQAIDCSPGALHFARVLPNPAALQQARAAGLADGRLACVRPGPGLLGVERALCLQWRIDTVLCRQSGGTTESLWRQICRDLDLRLLLLRRPSEPEGVTGLPFEALLQRLGAVPGAQRDQEERFNPDAGRPDP